MMYNISTFIPVSNGKFNKEKKKKNFHTNLLFGGVFSMLFLFSVCVCFYCSLLVCFSHEVLIKQCIHTGCLRLLVFPAQFCFSLCSKDGLVVHNSLIFCLFEKLLIPPLNLIDNPDGESILGCRLLPLITLNVSQPSGLQGFC